MYSKERKNLQKRLLNNHELATLFYYESGDFLNGRLLFAQFIQVIPSVVYSGKVDYVKERKQHTKKLSQAELIQKQLNTNFRIMEQIRARVDAIVEDPDTAAKIVQPAMLVCSKPPGKNRIQGAKPRNISCDNRVL